MALNETYTLNINITMLTQYSDDMIEQLEEICSEYSKDNNFHFDYNKMNSRGEFINSSNKEKLNSEETI